MASSNTPTSQHLSLYRKYRPTVFDQVVGQEQVVEALKGALQNGAIAHAYLFYGTRGTGKTSVARIFAAALGTSSNDLYEIDAASNNSVDQIRDLNESINTVPLQSRYKVYILDEVHMLSKAAFNAFLKTLEEPPKHVVFILATTELEKVPETVISRCQVFTFKKPNRTVLRQVVESTAKSEGFAIDGDAAELVALLGDGSFRDTHGVLQKVLSGAKKTVKRKDVERLTNAPKGELVNDLINSIAIGDLNKALFVVLEASRANIDISLFVTLIIQKVRAFLLLKYSPSAESFLKEDFSSEDFNMLKELVKKAGDQSGASSANASGINSLVLSELLSVSAAISRSVVPQAPLELALIRLIGQNIKATEK